MPAAPRGEPGRGDGDGGRSGRGRERGAELSTTASVLGGLAIAVALAALHLAAPRIRRLPGIPEATTGSFVGGLAVPYVFLHLLPEIAEGNGAVGELLADVVEPTPLLDLAIFAVALAGFALFYGLERRARGGEGDRGSPALFRLHLGSFVVYNALITYTMPLRLRTGVAFALLFTVAMAHFVLTDRSLEEHHPRRFARHGRLVLAAGLLLGWAAVALLAPSSTVAVALLTAFLGGSVLLNVFKEELPRAAGRASRGSSRASSSTAPCWRWSPRCPGDRDDLRLLVARPGRASAPSRRMDTTWDCIVVGGGAPG